ncbi:hydroxymethylpyrimidine/phosphomethylpyrimidine kinase [Nocardioides sp. MH1]|uniref:hydroxymethylpyrimidine/phosphomethylpyrimidine kinase n=1 Tax=Nocardioides sp. MH1 TaxID=3242490 RepID=UPI003521A91F
MTPPVVLTVAATDSGGGAGIAADLATFAALGVHGACVVTAVTAQDTRGIRAIHPVPAEVVAAQLDAVLDDLPVAVVKTGVLATPAAVVCLSTRLRSCSGTRPLLVVDPVLRASTGATLAGPAMIAAYEEHLFPIADVVTPNEDELEALGRPDHPGLLVTRGGAVVTTNDHGTGCTYSSALAAHLAHGADLGTAADAAAAFVAQQLLVSQDWQLGRGRGPVAHTIPEGARP